MTAPIDWTQFQGDQDLMQAPWLAQGGSPVAPTLPAAPTMAPQAPSGPGFFDRLSNGLFPTAASPLAGILNPRELAALRSRALLGLGANLLARSGPRPVGTSSPLSDIGMALGSTTQGWPGMLEGAASQAFQLNQLALQAKQRAAVQDFITQHPLPENASPSEVRSWVAQAIPAFLASGNEAGVAQLGQLMTGLEGGTPTYQKIVDRDPKSPTFGKTILGRVAKDGSVTPATDAAGNHVEPGIDEAAQAQHDAQIDNNLQSQWRGDKQVQNALGRMDTIGSAVSLAPDAIKGNATAQFGLLDNMIRTYNPNAIVRGNTVQQYLDLLPLSQRAQGEIQNLAAGKGKLSEPTIREMMTALQNIQGTTLHQLGATRNRFAKLAQSHGRDPSVLFDNPEPADFTGLTSAPAPVTPNPGGTLSRRAAKALNPQ